MIQANKSAEPTQNETRQWDEEQLIILVKYLIVFPLNPGVHSIFIAWIISAF